MSATITFRTDEDVKKRVEKIAAEMGVPVTSLLNAFMKELARQGKMPFELASNDYAHKKMIREKLQESLDYSKTPDAVRFTPSEFFDKARKELL